MSCQDQSSAIQCTWVVKAKRLPTWLTWHPPSDGGLQPYPTCACFRKPPPLELNHQPSSCILHPRSYLLSHVSCLISPTSGHLFSFLFFLLFCIHVHECRSEKRSAFRHGSPGIPRRMAACSLIRPTPVSVNPPLELNHQPSSCILHPVSCILSPVSGICPLVTFFLYLFSCLLPLASCLLPLFFTLYLVFILVFLPRELTKAGISYEL